MLTTRTVRHGSQYSVLAVVCGILGFFASEAFGAPVKSFGSAMAQAKRLASSDAGFRYKLKVAADLQQPLQRAAVGCTESPKETFALVLVVAADGRVEQVLPTPAHEVGACVAEMIKDVRVSRPPQGRWFVHLAMNSAPGKWWINVTMHRHAPKASNQAMQRTASKPATGVLRVCPPPFGCVAPCTGLAVADLVSR